MTRTSSTNGRFSLASRVVNPTEEHLNALADIESWIPEHILRSSRIRFLELHKQPKDVERRAHQTDPETMAREVQGFYNPANRYACVALWVTEDNGPTGRNFYHELGHSLAHKLTAEEKEEIAAEWVRPGDQGGDFADAFADYLVNKRRGNLNRWRIQYPRTAAVLDSWGMDADDPGENFTSTSKRVQTALTDIGRTAAFSVPLEYAQQLRESFSSSCVVVPFAAGQPIGFSINQAESLAVRPWLGEPDSDEPILGVVSQHPVSERLPPYADAAFILDPVEIPGQVTIAPDLEVGPSGWARWEEPESVLMNCSNPIARIWGKIPFRAGVVREILVRCSPLWNLSGPIDTLATLANRNRIPIRQDVTS